MRSGVKQIASLAILLFTGLWILSCGTSDFLDEPGQRYTGTLAVKDLDEETLSVDVIQNYCDEELEPFGPASAAVSIAVAADAPGISLRGYTLQYIPLPSEDGTGTIVMPPTLSGPLHHANTSADIASGGSASFDVTCISVDTKEEFRIKMHWFYYWEVAEGLAAEAAQLSIITAKETEIELKEAQITAIEYEIADPATPPGDLPLLELDLANAEADLAALNAELDELNVALNVIYNTLWTDNALDEARYKIRIVFDFEDTFGETRTITRETTVWFGNFDNC